MKQVLFLMALQCAAVACALPEEQHSPPRHIIFFGDSLMRYQYLAYVYQLHFPASAGVPAPLINEKLFSDWNSFFVNTTAMFGGAMTCDCFREASVKKLASGRENRRYTHPSGRLVASYFPLMGYFPIQGMRGTDIESSFGKLVASPDWKYTSPFTFVQKHLSRVWPTPSVVFVNSGHWNNKEVSKNPRKLLAMLEEMVLSPRPPMTMTTAGVSVSDSLGNVVEKLVEKEGNEEKDEKQDHGRCVAWLATTKPNIAWWAGARDADWNIMRGKFCHESLANTNTGTGENKDSTENLQKLRVCVFVPFKISVKNSDYFDHMHFSNETIYHTRTSLALKACNLQHSVFSTD